MEDKPDWANISGDEEEEQEEQEHQEHQGAPQGERAEGQNRGEYRPYNNTGRGRSGRGGRGGRGGPRGGGRGDYRGDRGDRGERGDRDQRAPKVKESQPKHEMIGLIKRGRDNENPLINLFDVDYKATEEDVRKIYQDVNIESVNMIKPGLFLLELQKDEALKLVEAGPKTAFNRPFFMKLGYSNKKQNPEEQWHTVNAEKHKREVGQREDRQAKGRKPNYNRKEQNEFADETPNQARPFHKNPRPNKPQEPVEMDPENKFFKGHDLTSNEFRIKFTNSSSKREEGESGQHASNKPNPFGDAKPRDESEYLKKKELEDEKDQVKDLQEHFEEKKDELKESKKGLPTPVNSPNTEFLEEGQKGEGKTEDKKAPPGISGTGYKGGNKKSGFVGNKPQQGGFRGEQKAEPVKEEKPKTTKSNKFNAFDALGDDE